MKRNWIQARETTQLGALGGIVRSPTMVAVVDRKEILSGKSDEANRACDVRYNYSMSPCDRDAIRTQSEFHSGFRRTGIIIMSEREIIMNDIMMES